MPALNIDFAADELASVATGARSGRSLGTNCGTAVLDHAAERRGLDIVAEVAVRSARLMPRPS